MKGRMRLTNLRIMQNPDASDESAVVFFYHDTKTDVRGYAAVPIETGDMENIQHLVLNPEFRNYLRIQLYLQAKMGAV